MATQPDNAIARVQSVTVYDDGEQQKFEAQGRRGERYGGTGGAYATPRVQSYGFTSHPPEGQPGRHHGRRQPRQVDDHRHGASHSIGRKAWLKGS